MRRVLTSRLGEAGGAAQVDQRVALAAQLTTILFPVLLELYSASAGPGVRHAALQAMLRMVVWCEPALLQSVLSPPFLSSQVR